MRDNSIYAVTFIFAESNVTVEQSCNVKSVAAGQTDQVLWEKWADNAQDAVRLAREEISSCKIIGKGNILIVAVDSETENELASIEIAF